MRKHPVLTDFLMRTIRFETGPGDAGDVAPKSCKITYKFF